MAIERQARKEKVNRLFEFVLAVTLLAAFEVLFPRPENISPLLWNILIATSAGLIAYTIARFVRYVRTRSARESADYVEP